MPLVMTLEIRLPECVFEQLFPNWLLEYKTFHYSPFSFNSSHDMLACDIHKALLEYYKNHNGDIYDYMEDILLLQDIIDRRNPSINVKIISA